MCSRRWIYINSEIQHFLLHFLNSSLNHDMVSLLKREKFNIVLVVYSKQTLDIFIRVEAWVFLL